MVYREKKFNPALGLTIKKAYEEGKQDANLVRDLLISEQKPGQSPGDDRSKEPYDKGWPPPAPLKPKLANFIGPSGHGTTLNEDEYWRGLQTIMETTEAGSDEQNKRLNILWHQYQDQVSNPADKMKIAKTPSQQNATNMIQLIKDLEKQGRYIDAKRLYDEQFPKA